MNFKEWLEENENSDGLRLEVMQELENYDSLDEVKSWLEDLTSNGCVSGMVGKLIYYEDTTSFYNDHEDEIEDILEEFKDNCGYRNRAEAISNLNGADSVGNITQEKNLLSWMAFEETGRKILEELEELEN